MTTINQSFQELLFLLDKEEGFASKLLALSVFSHKESAKDFIEILPKKTKFESYYNEKQLVEDILKNQTNNKLYIVDLFNLSLEEANKKTQELTAFIEEIRRRDIKLVMIFNENQKEPSTNFHLMFSTEFWQRRDVVFRDDINFIHTLKLQESFSNKLSDKDKRVFKNKI